ncbi:response regulator transcription factor [Sporolactobacillus pectinivorans]|uniref:response regulator transcription factor n=1 Tax=Sporolactobacillus pectinivorans TaxID=1591408 RepID=UPI000C2572D2|nr:response regulator transcription factor [Sporolactobacillus pectinivorans]
MVKILAIDDDPDILVLIKNLLRKDGHTVMVAETTEKVEQDSLTDYDMILLDVMMPGIDGFTFCRRIRSIVDCPILFLTAKTLETDIINGFGLGADDYITKPFGTGELRARVHAHLRREQRVKHSILCASGVRFDLSAKEVYVENKRISLTKSEYAICEFLAKNRGQVFSKDQIYENVFGFDGESDSSTVAEHIKNIRAKLSVFSLSPVSTVWGIGYKWI